MIIVNILLIITTINVLLAFILSIISFVFYFKYPNLSYKQDKIYKNILYIGLIVLCALCIASIGLICNLV